MFQPSTVAVLTHKLPVPPGEPGCPRLIALAECWSERLNLILLCRASETELQDHLERHPVLRELFVRIVLLPPPPAHFSLARKIKHRLFALPHFSYSARQPQYITAAKEQVARVLREYECSHVHVHGIECSEMLPDDLEACRITVDLVDSLALLYKRHAAVEPDILRRMDLLAESWSIALWTRRLLARGIAASVVSEDDAQSIGVQYGRRTAVVPNGCDPKIISRPVPARRAAKRLIFTGVMNYGPNIDAVQWFVQEVFPLIRSCHPDATFYIVGANPPEAVQQLTETAGVTVTGTVPDIGEYLQEASIFVSPLRSGAGIKNKVLTAMASKLPVVATSLGAAGVAVENGIHALLADSAADFAAGVNALLDGEVDAAAMTDQAFALLTSRYSWRRSADALMNLFAQEARREIAAAAAHGPEPALSPVHQRGGETPLEQPPSKAAAADSGNAQQQEPL